MLFLILSLFLQQTETTLYVYDGEKLVHSSILINSNGQEINPSTSGEFILKKDNLLFPIRIKTEGFVDIVLLKSQLTEVMSIYLHRDLYKMDEVAIVAQKSKISEGENFSAISVQAVKSVENASSNIKNRFSEVASILVQESSASGGSPIYKGFRANKLLFTVNGIRFNNALFKSGNTPYISLLNPVYFDHTSISDGANSLLFGSDAIGGAINFNVSSAENSKMIMSTGFESASNLFYTGIKSEHISENHTNRFGVYFAEGGDLSFGSNGNQKLTTFYNSSDEEYIAYQKVQPASYKQLNLDYDGSYKMGKTELGYGFHYGKQYDADDFFRLTQKEALVYQYDPLIWQMEYFSITRKINESSQIISKIYHQYFQEKKKETKSIGDKKVFDDAINVFGLNSSYYTKLTEKLNLSVGFDLVHEKSKTSSIGSTAKYPDNAIQFQKGIFVSGKYLYSSKFHFSSGIRYSSQHSEIPFLEELDTTIPAIPEFNTTFNSFTYSFGTHFQSDSWKSDLLFNSSFRAPNFDDLGKFGENKSNRLHLPNLDLIPEKAFSISSKTVFHSSQFIAETEIYGTFLSNLIEESDAFINGSNEIVLLNDTVGLRQNINISKGVIAGASIRLEYFIKKFNISNSTAFVYGENTDTKEPLSKIPPLQSIFKINYNYSDAVSFSSSFTYSSEQNRLSDKDKYSDDRIFPEGTPSYFKIDLSSTYRISNYTFSIMFENISDALYRNHASALNGRGRNLQLHTNIEL